MPAQVSTAKTVYYSQLDTAPNLRARLEDGNGDPINLTGATVTISIAYARYSYYYSPAVKIVDAYACVVDPDQTLGGNRGFVDYTPAVGHLTPPGEFLYYFQITFGGGGRQTVPANTYLPMVIKTPVAGVVSP